MNDQNIRDKIEPLGADDAGAMAKLHRSAFTPSWPSADMADHTRRDLVLGKRGAGRQSLDGFIIVSAAGDQAEVLTLVTDASKRRRGLATALLKSAEAMAAKRGVRDVFLEVAEDNPGAIELYQKIGYKRIGRRPAYYRRPNGRVAAVTFRKKLDEA